VGRRAHDARSRRREGVGRPRGGRRLGAGRGARQLAAGAARSRDREGVREAGHHAGRPRFRRDQRGFRLGRRRVAASARPVGRRREHPRRRHRDRPPDRRIRQPPRRPHRARARAPGWRHGRGRAVRRRRAGRRAHHHALTPRKDAAPPARPGPAPRGRYRRRMTTIHDLTAADRDEWLPPWRAYREFYEATLPEAVTESTFERLVAGRELHGALARDADGRAVGLVHWLAHPATWTTTTYCYLEDLFVSPDARGTGAGRALIEHARAWA